MIKSYAREMPNRIKGYVKENWGTPFISEFMLLLIATAALMVINSASLANDLVIFAYFALVVGVVVQLVFFLKYDKNW
jgi:heme/copper-type cytochrome/quinol oxidase subunit 4